jgi:16S rRNA (cytosine967-C5)-methyltransferase
VNPDLLTAAAVGSSPPLWQQLQACSRALQAVRRGQNHALALAPIEPRLRAGAQALLFAVLREWGRTQAIRQHLVSRSPPPAVDALLCVGLALAIPDTSAMYPMHTLVNQLVEAAKRDPATRAQAAFINACVRRFGREKTACLHAVAQLPQARWNHPEWWIKAVKQDHAVHWQAILQASQLAAPMTLRVNRRHISRDALQARWLAAGVQSRALGEDALVLTQARPVQALEGFAQAWFSVQDAGAQLAAPLLLQGLSARAGQALRVLDACAAPGGKTAHLLERADVEVTALDIDAARCERITENLQRLGLQATVVCADAAEPASWWDGRPFDAILLDAPCTASGIVRRHPDIPWLRRPSDLASLAAQQAKLLKALWPLLAEGGHLLYCTCSLFRQEGLEQVQAFLANNTQAQLLPSPGQLMPGIASNSHSVSDNLQGEHDGFFYALLERRATGT